MSKLLQKLYRFIYIVSFNVVNKRLKVREAGNITHSNEIVHLYNCIFISPFYNHESEKMNNLALFPPLFLVLERSNKPSEQYLLNLLQNVRK